MIDHSSAKLWAARVLRDNPKLRHISMREAACEMARKQSGLEIRHETFSRACRWLQNEQKLYLPMEDDQAQRDAAQASYKREYAPVSHN